MHYHRVRKTGGRGLWLLNKLRGMLVRPALGPRASGSVVLIEGHTMGTHYRIRLPATAARHDHAELRAAIQVLLRHLDKGVFSTWEPSSELSRFNQLTAPAQFSTSTDMLALTRMAQTVHELSQGAFDPTVGALVDLWGFGPTASTGRIPAQADIERNRKLQGFEQLRVDETSGTMFKSHPVTLDYSAIAKGYGLDRVAALLEEHGLHDYLVEIGGELLACGEKAPGQEWPQAALTPACPQSATAVNALPLPLPATTSIFSSMKDNATAMKSIQRPAGRCSTAW